MAVGEWVPEEAMIVCRLWPLSLRRGPLDERAAGASLFVISLEPRKPQRLCVRGFVYLKRHPRKPPQTARAAWTCPTKVESAF